MKLEYSKNRITLRILTESYAPEVLNFYYDNREFFDPLEAAKPENFYTLEFQEDLLRAELNMFLSGKSVRFFVFSDEQPDKIIGTISFLHIRKGAFMSGIIGYKVHKDYLRQGIAYHSISLALDAITSEMGLHRIEAYIHPDNAPSIALAGKLGFVPEGTAYDYVRLNDKWCDHLRYIYISAYQ